MLYQPSPRQHSDEWLENADLDLQAKIVLQNLISDPRVAQALAGGTTILEEYFAPYADIGARLETRWEEVGQVIPPNLLCYEGEELEADVITEAGWDPSRVEEVQAWWAEIWPIKKKASELRNAIIRVIDEAGTLSEHDDDPPALGRLRDALLKAAGVQLPRQVVDQLLRLKVGIEPLEHALAHFDRLCSVLEEHAQALPPQEEDEDKDEDE